MTVRITKPRKMTMMLDDVHAECQILSYAERHYAGLLYSECPGASLSVWSGDIVSCQIVTCAMSFGRKTSDRRILSRHKVNKKLFNRSTFNRKTGSQVCRSNVCWSNVCRWNVCRSNVCRSSVCRWNVCRWNGFRSKDVKRTFMAASCSRQPHPRSVARSNVIKLFTAVIYECLQ